MEFCNNTTNKICKEFDLRVVITSTWRTNHTIEQLQQIFTEQGIEVHYL
jgi:hypothetical protein